MRRRIVGAALLSLTGLLLLPAPAQAHPLGNFTTNQYAGLRIGSAGVDVDYVLDLAELPSYQAQQEEIDADGDGTQTDAERAAYAARTCAAAATASTVTVGGKPQPLTARPAGLTFPAGAGGLTTLRLQCVLHADADLQGRATIGFTAGMLADRIGWREITAVGDRFTLERSDVPAVSTSNRLTAYPAGVAGSDVRTANLTVLPGGPAAAPAPYATAGGTQARGVDRFTNWFTGLVGHPRLTLGIGLLALLIALVLGGAHAVAPGHGKTIMAAYLVGSRGRLSQALTVAATVATTHTVGVLLLGMVLATSLQLAPDTMYAWLRLTSGVLVALVGAHLLRRAVRRLRAHPAADHDHGPGHSHQHPHEHEHELVPAGVPASHSPDDEHEPVAAAHSHQAAAHLETHTHSHGGRPHTHHLPAPDEPMSVRSLLAMGFAGGLSPSPSAVVVLLGAAALGRAWYGVLLVLAYGIGLAATLIGIGYALAHWGERLRQRTSHRWSRILTHRMPTATAAVILLVGVAMVALAAVTLLDV
jgi:ABC-type nickel/cobalt efflux system permease component RcnA